MHTNHMLGYRKTLKEINIRALPKQFDTYIPHSGGSREVAFVFGSTSSLRHNRHTTINSKQEFYDRIKIIESRSNWIDGLHTGRYYYDLDKVRFHSDTNKFGEHRSFLKPLEYCDLSFDFDLSDYDGIRRCGCIEKDACFECLTFLDEIVSAFIQYLKDGFYIELDCYTPQIIETYGTASKRIDDQFKGEYQIHPRHILTKLD